VHITHVSLIIKLGYPNHLLTLLSHIPYPLSDIAISRPGQIMPSPESASAAGLTIPALEQASGYDKLGVAHIGLLRHVLERSCYESEALLDDSRALKIYAPRMLMHKV